MLWFCLYCYVQVEHERNAYKDAMVLACDSFVPQPQPSWYDYISWGKDEAPYFLLLYVVIVFFCLVVLVDKNLMNEWMNVSIMTA